ncbi:hypothetical protein D3C86_2196870 [compost metagenome]
MIEDWSCHRGYADVLLVYRDGVAACLGEIELAAEFFRIDDRVWGQSFQFDVVKQRTAFLKRQMR